MTLEVMQLELQGLPYLFNEKQLQRQTRIMISDISSLLQVDRLLLFTTLCNRYRLCSDRAGTPLIFLVLELTPRPQQVLNFEANETTPGTLERRMLEDRQRMRHACEELPVQTSHTMIALAQRLQAAFLDLPDGPLMPETERQLTAVINSRHRRWNGHLEKNHPWQLELPKLPRYEWIGTPIHLRTQLLRERSGFTLKLLRRTKLPAVLHSVQTLRMPKRPSKLEDASVLDRAEYTATPIELIVRIGNVIGSDVISVADFVRLAWSKLRRRRWNTSLVARIKVPCN